MKYLDLEGCFQTDDEQLFTFLFERGHVFVGWRHEMQVGETFYFQKTERLARHVQQYRHA